MTWEFVIYSNEIQKGVCAKEKKDDFLIYTSKI
jgi:hypothetical protein